MTRKKYGNDSGFVALISVVLISAIVVVMLFTANVSSFYSRFDILDSEYKYISLKLASSCANVALLSLAQNYQYDIKTDPLYKSGIGLPVKTYADDCYIKSIEPQPPRLQSFTNITVFTQGIHKNTFSNLKVEAILSDISSVATTSNIKIVSWTEF